MIPGFVCAMSSDGAEPASLYPTLALHVSLDASSARVSQEGEPKALPSFPEAPMPAVLIRRQRHHFKALGTADVRLPRKHDVLQGSEDPRVDVRMGAGVIEADSSTRPSFGPLRVAGKRLRRYGHEGETHSFSSREGALGSSLVQLWAASSRRKPQPDQAKPLAQSPKHLPHPQLSSFSEPASRLGGKSTTATLTSLSAATDSTAMVTAPAHLHSMPSNWAVRAVCAGTMGLQAWPVPGAPPPDAPCWGLASGCDMASAAPALGLGPEGPGSGRGVTLAAQLMLRTRQGKRRWVQKEHQDMAARLDGATCTAGTPENDRGPGMHPDPAEQGTGGTSHQNVPEIRAGVEKHGVDSPAWRQGFHGDSSIRTGTKREASGALHGLPFKIQRTASGADSACGTSACNSPEVASSAMNQPRAVPSSSNYSQRARAESHASQGRSGSAQERSTSGKPPLATSAKPGTATSPEAQQAAAGRAGLAASLGLNQEVLDAIQSKLAHSGERIVTPRGEEGQGEVELRVSEEGSLGSLSTGAILALCRTRKGCGTQLISVPGGASKRKQGSEDVSHHSVGEDAAIMLTSPAGEPGDGPRRRDDGELPADVATAVADQSMSAERPVPQKVLELQGSINMKGHLPFETTTDGALQQRTVDPQASIKIEGHLPQGGTLDGQVQQRALDPQGSMNMKGRLSQATGGQQAEAKGMRHPQDGTVALSDLQASINRQTSFTDECRGCTPSVPLRFPSGDDAQNPVLATASPLPPGEMEVAGPQDDPEGVPTKAQTSPGSD